MTASRIHIAVPVYNAGMSAATTATMIDLCKAGLLDSYDLRSSSDLPRLRAVQLEVFVRLHADASHVLLLDADMHVPVDAVRRMLAVEKDFVALAYAKKQIDIDAIGRAARAGRADWKDAGTSLFGWYVVPASGDHELVEATVVGLGAALLTRRAVERMIAAHPELRYPQDDPVITHVTHLFLPAWHPVGGPLNEADAFCHRWRALGEAIYVVPDVDVGHVGTFVYRGNLARQIAMVGT